MSKTVPETTIRWRHTPNAPAGSSLPALLACQPDMTIPATADADEIGDQVGARVRELMERHRIHLDVVALVDGDEVTVVDADEPEVCFGQASIIRPSQPDADRRAAYDLVHAGIVAGLPIPESLLMYGFRSLTLVFDDADQAAVDQWVGHLDLPASEFGEPRNKGRFRSYGTSMVRSAVLPGWLVQVYCSVPVESRTESDR